MLPELVKLLRRDDSPALQVSSAKLAACAAVASRRPSQLLTPAMQTMATLPPAQLEAAWAITNVASGESKHTDAVVALGGVPEFLRLLDSPDEQVCGQAAWGLGNIAGDSVQHRNLVLGSGALAKLCKVRCACSFVAQPLLRLWSWVAARGCASSNRAHGAWSVLVLQRALGANNTVSVVRRCVWALTNLCRGQSVILDDVRPDRAADARVATVARNRCLILCTFVLCLRPSE